MVDPLKEAQEWVKSYREDDSPIHAVGTEAAVRAMEFFLEVFTKHGQLRDGAVMELTQAQIEVHRAVEILSCFEGKLAMLQWMHTGKHPFADDDDDD